MSESEGGWREVCWGRSRTLYHRLSTGRQLLASIQNGEPGQVVAVLEHGLTLLEKLSILTPRKARRQLMSYASRWSVPWRSGRRRCDGAAGEL